MRYHSVEPAVFLERPNRFIARVICGGREETAHVKNTGRCRELLIPGARVYVQRHRNPARKTALSLIAVEKDGRLVNIDSQAPNAVWQEALAGGLLLPGRPEAAALIRREAVFGDSRLDFYIEWPEVRGWITLDKALEIALDENPTMKVAAEEIALKKVASKETWQNLLPEASISGSVDHTIKAAEMKLNDMSFKMGQDGTNTANAGLNINLPLFVPGVYRAMSMTKTDIELAVEKSRASKLDLVNQVSKAYYQLMLAQDSYEVLQGSYKLAEDNYNVVNAKYQQGTVSEYDKISAEVQMRSIKPNLISAANIHLHFYSCLSNAPFVLRQNAVPHPQ